MNPFRNSFLLALLSLGLIFLLGIPSSPESSGPAPKESFRRGRGPGNPGFEAQWRIMRQDEHGNIPRRPFHAIWEAESLQKTQVTSLNTLREMGPYDVGGRTRTLIFDQNNPNRILAGGVSGGVWASPDKGISWTPLSDFASTLSVTSLVQDPQNFQTLYFSTGESRGNSAGIAGEGIFKSTDGGGTFAALASTANTNFDYIWKLAMPQPVSQTGWLYAATAGEGLWRSTDGGGSFENVFAPQTVTIVTDIELTPDGGVMIAVRDQGVFFSQSGNAGTFLPMGTGLPTSAFRRIELAIAPSDTNILYAAVEDSLASMYSSDLKGVWKSTDRGATWTEMTNPALSPGLAFSFPWYCLMLSVKPNDPDYVVIGSVDMGYSTDGGLTWDYAAYSHADNHVAAWDPSDPNSVFVGNDGGIHQYATATISWDEASKNNGYNVTQYYTGAFFPNGEGVTGGTQDNGTHTLRNGVAVSEKWFGGDGSFCAINQQNANTAYVSYQYGTIHKCTDASNVWPNFNSVMNDMDSNGDFSIDDGAWFINPFEINSLDGEQLYFTTYQRIWRTTNGASTWTPITNNISSGTDKPYIVGLSNDVNPTLYIGGGAAMFYRVDNAQTATAGSEVDLSASVPANVTSHFISNLQVHPSDPSTVFVSFSTFSTEPRVWKVTEANTPTPVWTSVSGNLPANLPVNWLALHPQNPNLIMLAATDFGLYETTDGGTTWTKETTIPNVPVFAVKARPSDLKVFIYTHGRGVWVADWAPSVGRPAPMTPSVQVYPNPASESLWVKGKKGTHWKMLTVSGAQVAQGVIHTDLAQSLSVQQIPSGTYFLQFSDGQDISTQKVVITR